MKRLAEHNKERSSEYWKRNSEEPRLNGIACPDCLEQKNEEVELYDERPNQILTSAPPQLLIKCHICGYTGYRIK